MELLAMVALLFFLVAPLLWIFNLVVASRKETPAQALQIPPGNLGWPLIGETFRYAVQSGSTFYDERVAKYGAVFKTSLFGSKTVVLPAPEGNRLILMNENKLVSVSYPKSVSVLLGENSLIALRGDEHRRSKALLMTFLRPEMLQKFVGRVCKVVHDHLQKFWSGGDEVIRVYNLMKMFTFALACDLLMGLDIGDEEMEFLARDFDTLVRGLFQLPIDLPGTQFCRAKAARKKLDQCFDRHIREKRREIAGSFRARSHEQDMLEVLLTTRDENGEFSTDLAIKDNIVSLLFAGHDTSSVALTWTLKFLADSPSCMDKIVQENLAIRNSRSSSELSWEDLRKLKYTWQVVQESMRMRPPVGGGFREALVDLEFDGYVVPKGWKLNWTTATSYRKPEFFVEPNKFDPSRFDGGNAIAPYTFLPFGAGARMCPGSEFAKMEILVFLHYCVLQFDWKLLEPNEQVIIDPMPRPVHGMPVRISKRN
ncbi:cytochrome P450 716B1 [Selaginella moellendorffii]|uniref:cytochrome P450 716B1 n=1 Tax=Selaginella moellendorffii TaxID=88036 RepID=UPI000D1C3A71|nr:cytochrome P450 716B1 [Selaginella moellendorffii]|eukprot:XP_024542157.1 cytochrome P450 716B1 [Selaginella moellendorffii]